MHTVKAAEPESIRQPAASTSAESPPGSKALRALIQKSGIRVHNAKTQFKANLEIIKDRAKKLSEV